MILPLKNRNVPDYVVVTSAEHCHGFVTVTVTVCLNICVYTYDIRELAKVVKQGLLLAHLGLTSTSMECSGARLRLRRFNINSNQARAGTAPLV